MRINCKRILKDYYRGKSCGNPFDEAVFRYKSETSGRYPFIPGWRLLRDVWRGRVIGAEILGIVQTKRANGVAQHVEMAGFPHHALDSYLPKLVRAGKRVAICDQLEDPKLTKKLVKRGITELVTPGVSINDNILNHKENNFLASIHFAKEVCGISFLDISTGEFMTAEGSIDYIDKLLNNFSPKEVLIERGNKKRFEEAFGPRFFIFELDDWIFTTSLPRIAC